MAPKHHWIHPLFVFQALPNLFTYWNGLRAPIKITEEPPLNYDFPWLCHKVCHGHFQRLHAQMGSQMSLYKLFLDMYIQGNRSTMKNLFSNDKHVKSSTCSPCWKYSLKTPDISGWPMNDTCYSVLEYDSLHDNLTIKSIEALRSKNGGVLIMQVLL